MLVKQVMHRDVIKAPPEATVREISRMMVDNHVGSVVVVKNEQVVGIITDRNVLELVAKDGRTDFESAPVGDVMTRYVHYISSEAKLQKALDMMTEYKIKKLPVVRDEKLVGIITSSDIAAEQSEVIDSVRRLLSKKLKPKTK